MIVAQITDMHVKRRGLVLHHMPHVARPLERALSALAGLPEPPACIVATGDLTENGTPQEYARLREILSQSPIPVHLLAGNHDRRDHLKSAFATSSYLHEFGPGAIQYTVEAPALRIVAIDTSQHPRVGGYLDSRRLAWLQETLAKRPATPTLLAMPIRRFRPVSAISIAKRSWDARRSARSFAPIRRFAESCAVTCIKPYRACLRGWPR